MRFVVKLCQELWKRAVRDYLVERLIQSTNKQLCFCKLHFHILFSLVIHLNLSTCLPLFHRFPTKSIYTFFYITLSDVLWSWRKSDKSIKQKKYLNSNAFDAHCMHFLKLILMRNLGSKWVREIKSTNLVFLFVGFFVVHFW